MPLPKASATTLLSACPLLLGGMALFAVSFPVTQLIEKMIEVFEKGFETKHGKSWAEGGA